MGAANHPARGPHPRLALGAAFFTVLPAIVLAGTNHDRVLVALVVPGVLFVLLGVDWLRSREAWLRFVDMRAQARWYDVLLLGGNVWPRSEEHSAPERLLGSAITVAMGGVFAGLGITELIDWL